MNRSLWVTHFWLSPANPITGTHGLKMHRNMPLWFYEITVCPDAVKVFGFCFVIVGLHLLTLKENFSDKLMLVFNDCPVDYGDIYELFICQYLFYWMFYFNLI
jgi:hypothetical protein